jgi:hypothetical protein
LTVIGALAWQQVFLDLLQRGQGDSGAPTDDAIAPDAANGAVEKAPRIGTRAGGLLLRSARSCVARSAPSVVQQLGALSIREARAVKDFD